MHMWNPYYLSRSLLRLVQILRHQMAGGEQMTGSRSSDAWLRKTEKSPEGVELRAFNAVLWIRIILLCLLAL